MRNHGEHEIVIIDYGAVVSLECERCQEIIVSYPKDNDPRSQELKEHEEHSLTAIPFEDSEGYVVVCNDCDQDIYYI